MDSLKVSVVIPTYNRKESLKKTLESLFEQTYPKHKYEIIVCDDYKSTDGTEKMLTGLMRNPPCELKYFKIKSEYKGPAAARNVGIENARGEIIGFTDDDCIVSPNWIENTIPFFDDETIYGVQGATLLPRSDSNSIISKFYRIRISREATKSGPKQSYATCNVFYRKKALLEIGGFDPRFTMAREDMDVAWGLLDKGYKILFSENSMVYHEIRSIPFLKYLKSLKQLESLALFVKKHPLYRQKLFLRFVAVKTNIYPIFILLAIFSYLGSYRTFFNLSMVTAIIIYLLTRVITDSNVKMYPLRILAFIRYLLIDFISLYYTVKGVIRYKCFVL